MRTFKRIRDRGFTLVELMIVVAIIGVLAALAIYGVRKYLLNAKTAEAKEGIGRISKDASSAYDREGMPSTTLTLNASAGITHRLCPPAALVPTSKDSIKGQKWQSSPANWTGTGWNCLKFSMKDPQYFQYQYYSSGTTGTASETFVVNAHGDLNGDGTTSTFTIGGSIQSATSGGLVLTVAPNFSENLPEE
ncbi:MAG: fimbiral protein pilA [Deltaproteobacteria bacterium HGW-Deltaproteobacteria-20]|nr:MAG: fimbiral protein pilA [Deltaproteobacteria bacterium HGW-Deltaproteobacteria-20]